MGLLFTDGFDDGLALRGKWDKTAGDLTLVDGRHAMDNAAARLAMRLGPSNTSTERIEDNSTRIAYVGTWTQASYVDASGGTTTRSKALDSTASLTFTGTGVRWLTVLHGLGGIAEVFIDDVLVATVDTYASTTQWKVVGYENLSLSHGEHTIRIRVTGTKHSSSSDTIIHVDAFDVVPVGTVLVKNLGTGAHPTVMAGHSVMSSDGATTPAIVPAAKLLTLQGGSTDRLRIALNADGTLTAYNGATALGTSTRALAAGEHHYLEVRRVVGTAGSALVRLDGFEVLNVAIADAAEANIDTVIMEGHNATAGGLVADDLWILNGAGTPAPALLGDVTIETHYPNANGAYSQLLGSDGDRIDNFALVNNAGAPDEATYVETATVGERDSYGLSNLIQSDEVKGVVLSGFARRTAAEGANIALTMRSGTTDVEATAEPLDLEHKLHRWVMEKNPISGAAWTPTDVNAAEFGARRAP